MSTYWKRVRYDGDIEPWELREIPGKGYAAFATRSFKKGEWICTEFPVTWIHEHHPFNSQQLEEIDEKVDKMTEEDREAFLAMANVYNVDETAVNSGIFMTNCFDMTDSIFGKSCAMYLALGRLNHSCSPNVQQTHIPETTEEVAYASRDIEVGDELNDCYIDLRQSRAARREELLDLYKFSCECDCCTGKMFEKFGGSPDELEKSIADDDRMRVKAYSYQDIITDLIEQNDDTQLALDVALQTCKQLETPKYLVWSVRYLHEAYMMVYQLARDLRNKSLAREYLVKAHELSLKLEGPRSKESARLAILVQEFK